MKRFVSSAFLASLILGLSLQTSPAQVTLLPSGALTHSTVPGVTATVVDTVETVQFTVTFNGLPSGLSVGNQSYLGWCPDFWGDFNNNNASTPYTLFSTYDTAHLPLNAQSPNWAIVNWVLNNKPSGPQSTWIVQQVLWRILANQYAPANQGFPLPEPATDNLYNQAIAQGPGFVPAVGQTIGVLMYIDGIDPFPAQNGLPSNGQPNNFQEVLIEVPVGPGAIGDFVWQDSNQNGIQDAGEPGINGVTVKLCADSSCSTVLATTTTTTFKGMGGYYQFFGLPLGTYWISVDTSQPALSGLVATVTGAGTAATDSNVNPSVTTLTTSQPQDETIDFGFTSPGTSAIGDFVWQDNNANGLQDAGEPGIPGLTVNLCADAACNTILATTTTDQNGAYHFTGLFAGTYYVVVIPGAGFVSTSPQVGFPTNSQTDSGGNVAGVPSEVTLPVNTTDNSIDFGFIPPAQGAIGDFVWHDLSRNGIQDAGEPGINNVTVRLFDSSNTLVGTTSTVTNSGQDGYYQFTGLLAGTYTVVVDSTTLPPGYTPTTSNAAGSTPANDSNGSPATVTLATNISTDETIDFGYVSPCAGVIGDFVWNDLNGNGIQDAGEPGIPGVTVNLYDSNHVFLFSTTTDANGNYHFNGRCAEGYTVEVVTPSGFQPTISNAPGSTPANDSNGSPASVTLGIDETNNTIDFGYYQSLSVTCPANASGEVGAVFNASAVTVSGGIPPYKYSVASGSLPAGLTLDASTGIITGTPLAAGSFTIQVTDAANNVSVTACPYTVVAGPSLTCSAVTAGEVGVAFNSPAMTVTGGTAPFKFTVATGTLPAGLTLDAGTGAITGTPQGPGTFTIQVTDANGVVATGTCPFTIVAPPSVTCSTSNSGEVGVPFNSPAMTVTGGTAPFKFTVATGTLPAGLTLDAGTGAITGTPQGPGTFTIQVTDANGVVATGTCPFTIVAPPSVTCSTSNSGEVGVPFNSPAMTVTGGTAPFKFTVATGTLPAGLTLNASTGAITGTPQGPGTFTIQVTDANGVVATGTCPFTIVGPPSVTCSTSNSGEVGVAFNSPAMTVTGGTAPFKFTVATGTIPAGLTLNASTGAITGTPQGPGTFTIQVTDANGVVATGTCPFTIVAPPSVTCSTTNSGEVGVAFNSPAMTVTGGTAPFKFTVATGSLPAGLTLNASTGAITGTPQGPGTFTIQVTDANGVVATGTCPFTIVAPPSVTCSTTNSGEVGVPFNSPAMTVTGGTAPFKFTVATGSLPAGLTLNASTGAITGTPQGPGTFTIQVTDANGVVAAGTCPFTIVGPPSVTCSTSNTGIVGAAFNSPAMTVTGGTPPYKFTVATGTLPAGLTLNASTGAITGTPQGAGSFTIQVTDAKGVVAAGTCPFTIYPAISASCVVINATQGVAITPVTLTAVGGFGGPYTFSATGLPAGLTISSSGTISGTPLESGTFPYTVTITDRAGNTGTLNCSLTIAPSLPTCGVNLGPLSYNVSEQGSNVAGEIVWFNSHLTKLGGTIPTSDFQIYVQNGKITFGTLTLTVPNAVINFTASASCASTSFDTIANEWVTTLPLSAAKQADEIFAAGLAYQLPAGFAQNVSNVTWSATVYSSASALQISWQYGVSNWLTQHNGTSFPVLGDGSPDYNGMMIDPAHNAPLCNPAYNTADHAGAPEFAGRQNVLTGGGSGGGGSNWTGSFSSTPPLSGFVCSGGALGRGDTATIGFWHNKNGQALIDSLNGGPTATNLANWLATQFPHLYGPQSPNNLTGKTNADVAALFMTFFGVTGQKTNAQILGGALAAYVTNTSLAGTVAGQYGFNTSPGGTGSKTYNVGSYGTAIGLQNNTSYTVMQLLQQANLDLQNGTYNANAFNSIFSGINQLGDIS